MPIIQAKCSNCFATLSVDVSKNNAICPFCGSEYIIENTNNQYNTYNQVTNIYVVSDPNSLQLIGSVLQKKDEKPVKTVFPNNVTVAEMSTLSDSEAVMRSNSDFQIKDGVLIKYNGNMNDIVIPDSVTVIGKTAFSDCTNAINVIIPKGVIEIEANAFCNCSRLVEITIPGSVRRIGDCSFMGCNSLVKVSLDNGTEYIGDSAFNGCVSLKSVSMPDSICHIGKQSFKNCKSLSYVRIPNGVTEISGLFYGCGKLKTVSIQDSLKKVSADSFAGCKMLTGLQASAKWKQNHLDILLLLADNDSTMKKGHKSLLKSIMLMKSPSYTSYSVIITKYLNDDYDCYPTEVHMNRGLKGINPVIGKFNYDANLPVGLRREIIKYLVSIGIKECNFTQVTIPIWGKYTTNGKSIVQTGKQKALKVSFVLS